MGEAWLGDAVRSVHAFTIPESAILTTHYDPTCRDAQITAQTFYRWRKEFGGPKQDQAKRLKELEKENAKLKRLVAELSLEKQILKDVAEGNL